MSLTARLVAFALVCAFLAALGWRVQVAFDRAEKRGYDRRVAEQTAEALTESQAKAREGFRRMEAQDANQRKQDEEVRSLRAAAARNAADADRVRKQAADAARDWAQRLADSPTREDLEAAAAAIGVSADLLGRADRRASLLAEYADAARAAGLKCERDYDSLTTAKP